jgi:hypothetical protein
VHPAEVFGLVGLVPSKLSHVNNHDSCQDPSDILWENLGTPRVQQIVGRLFTSFLLLALLVATYFVVDNVSILAMCVLFLLFDRQ